MTIKKESGPGREFDTGARKQNAEGKGTPSLFPGDAYLEICKHFEDGATHYEPRNWEKGIPLSKLIDSLERHIAQEKMGLTDESHDRAIAWNAICYLATKLRIKAGILPKELDDLCGVYGKEQPVDDCVIKRTACYYYIRSLANGYLWKDLRFHVYTGSGESENINGCFSTREEAEECLQKYKDKQENKYNGYCEECWAKLSTAKDGELVPICEKCAKLRG